MKLLKVKGRLNNKNLTFDINEYDNVEEKAVTYFIPNGRYRIRKDEMMRANTRFNNHLPTYEISFETYCLPEEVALAKDLIKNKILETLNSFRESLDEFFNIFLNEKINS